MQPNITGNTQSVSHTLTNSGLTQKLNIAQFHNIHYFSIYKNIRCSLLLLEGTFSLKSVKEPIGIGHKSLMKLR